MSVKAEQVEITSPCPITLDRSAVSARDKSMFCAHCTKDVHLLSQMTEPEARALLKAEAGRDICVSYAIRADGSIRFREDDAIVPLSALSRRPTPPLAPLAPPRRMSLVASIGASMLLAACTPHDLPEEQPVGGIQAEVPCDEGPVPVAGGLQALPLPEPEPEQLVDGGIRAVPLPEEPPVVDEKTEAKIDHKPVVNKRGGIRARPINLDPPSQI